MALVSPKIRQLEDCCGAFLIYGLTKVPSPRDLDYYRQNYSKSSLEYSGIDQEYVDNWNNSNQTETTESYAERISAFLREAIRTRKGEKSYYILILNTEQKVYAESVVLSCGFEVLIPEMRNPTGTEITTYVYYLMDKPYTDAPKKPPQTSIIKRG
jgi:hypothetical protein